MPFLYIDECDAIRLRTEYMKERALYRERLRRLRKRKAAARRRAVLNSVVQSLRWLWSVPSRP